MYKYANSLKGVGHLQHIYTTHKIRTGNNARVGFGMGLEKALQADRLIHRLGDGSTAVSRLLRIKHS